LGTDWLVTGDLVLAEVLQGFRPGRDCRLAESLLTALPVVNLLDRGIAIRSARNYRLLRKKGLTVRRTVDCIIATWCIENRTRLLHADRDFLPFEQHLALESALDLPGGSAPPR
jgi:predicted nucleic acid-binding protein